MAEYLVSLIDQIHFELGGYLYRGDKLPAVGDVITVENVVSPPTRPGPPQTAKAQVVEINPDVGVPIRANKLEA